jgi:signal-transduction protein with cAMP-binding, CBS, and nucleotidyltransferase domain
VPDLPRDASGPVRPAGLGGSMQTVSHLLRQKGNEFFWVAPTDSVRKAIELMATHHVGALLVMNPGSSSLVGIISERDYARKVILKNRSSQDTPVSEIMTSPAVTVTLTDTVRHCMEMMTQHRFRHLPVVEAGRVVGILSIGDLVKAVIEEQTAQIEQLERYIAG